MLETSSIPKWGILRLLFTAVYPGRALAGYLDLPAGRHPRVDRHAVVANPDPRDPLRLRATQKTTLYPWMDRITGGVFMLFAARLALSHR
jgi:hypothetical protein